MFVEFSIRPGRLARQQPNPMIEIETLETTADETAPRSMHAALEGSWEQVMSVIRGCHQELANGNSRVITTIVVVEDQPRRSWPRCLVEAVAPPCARGETPEPSLRRIPLQIAE